MKFRHRMGGGVETGFCHKIDFLQKCNMYITLYYICHLIGKIGKILW